MWPTQGVRDPIFHLPGWQMADGRILTWRKGWLRVKQFESAQLFSDPFTLIPGEIM